MKKQQLLVIAFFGIFLLYGLISFKDYGISTDEVYQRDHSLGAYKEIVPSVADTVTDTVNFPLASSSPYGVLMQLPMVAVEHLTQFSLSYRQIFLIRHLYTFLVFFVSVIFFYGICKRFTDNRLLALMGPAMLILSPRILAESFYNIKDVMCMSLMSISLYYGLRYIDRPTPARMIPFAAAVFLCADCRIVGAVVFPAAILIVLIKKWKDGTWKKYLLQLIACVALLLLAYMLFSGKTPKDVLFKVINTIKVFSNYRGWEGTNYFFGKYYEAGTLPRYYIFVWIAITTPVCYLLLFLAGVIASFKKTRSGQASDQWFLLICMGIPLAYILICNPILYNGWRHFYFIYPEIIALAFYGFLHCVQKAKNSSVCFLRALPVGALGLCMLCSVLWMFRNHPYEYVYFNLWSEPYAFKNFNKDYWHVSEDQSIREIIWQETADTIRISTLLENNSYLLSPQESARVEWVPQEEADSADYYILCYTEDPETQLFEFWDMYEETDSVTVDGRKINSTYRRVYDTALQSIVAVEEGDRRASYDLNGGIVWQEDLTSCRLTGTLEEGVASDRLHLDVQGDFPADTLSVFVSQDGTHWTQATAIRNTEYGITVDYPMSKVNYVRFCWDREDAGGDKNWWMTVSVYTQKGTISDPAYQNRQIETVTATAQPWEALKAIDGDQKSRWSTGVYQEPGMSYTVKLRELQNLAGLILYSGVSQWDAPVQLVIYGSEDGENWEEIAVKEQRSFSYSFAESMAYQWIRMEIGETDETVPYNWSIDELYIMKTADKETR